MSASLPRQGLLVDDVHCFPVRVYYEDTDAAGIVYYANYLKFIERARTEMIRLCGVEHRAAQETQGFGFIVRRAAIEYEAPARLDDELVVETRVQEIGGATILLVQDVKRDDARLVRATVLIACVDRAGRPTRLPPELRAALPPRNDNNTPRMVNAHAR